MYDIVFKFLFRVCSRFDCIFTPKIGIQTQFNSVCLMIFEMKLNCAFFYIFLQWIKRRVTHQSLVLASIFFDSVLYSILFCVCSYLNVVTRPVHLWLLFCVHVNLDWKANCGIVGAWLSLSLKPSNSIKIACIKQITLCKMWSTEVRQIHWMHSMFVYLSKCNLMKNYNTK